MKNQNLILSFLAMFFGLSLVFSSQFVLGQDSKTDKEYSINGEEMESQYHELFFIGFRMVDGGLISAEISSLQFDAIND